MKRTFSLALSLAALLAANHLFAQGTGSTQFNPLIKLSYGLEPAVLNKTPLVQDKIAMPAYPSELVRQGIAGEVTFECLLADDGKIEKLSIIKATHEALGKEVMETVKAWKFGADTDKAEKHPARKLRGTFTFVPMAQE